MRTSAGTEDKERLTEKNRTVFLGNVSFLHLTNLNFFIRPVIEYVSKCFKKKALSVLWARSLKMFTDATNIALKASDAAN